MFDIIVYFGIGMLIWHYLLDKTTFEWSNPLFWGTLTAWPFILGYKLVFEIAMAVIENGDNEDDLRK